MKKYITNCLLIFLFVLLFISCSKEKKIKIRANYFMNIDTLKIVLKDNHKNILLDTAFDAKRHINISMDAHIILSWYADSLIVLINDTDTSLSIKDLPRKVVDVAYTNMFYGINDSIRYGAEYERIIINRTNFKPYE